MPEQYSIQEFAKILREQWPDTANVPDMTLVGKTIAANPSLKQYLKTSPDTSYSSPEYPQGASSRTATEVMQDQAANVLKGIPTALTGIPGFVRDLAIGPVAKAFTGNASGAVTDVGNMVKTAALPITVPARQL